MIRPIDSLIAHPSERVGAYRQIRKAPAPLIHQAAWQREAREIARVAFGKRKVAPLSNDDDAGGEK